jgi:hypothetical protein
MALWSLDVERSGVLLASALQLSKEGGSSMCYYIVENMDGDTYVLAGPYETYDEALYWVTPTIAKLEEERKIGEVFVKAYPDGTDFHTHFCPTHVCTGDCHKEKGTCTWKDRRD